MCKAILALLVSFACPVLLGQEHGAEQSRKVRTYYIAADEVDWDYAPLHKDQITGEKFHFEDEPGSKGMLDPNVTVYRKAIFREYTAALSSYLNLVPRPGSISASSGR